MYTPRGERAQILDPHATGLQPEPPLPPVNIFCDICCDLLSQAPPSPAAKQTEKYPSLAHLGIVRIIIMIIMIVLTILLLILIILMAILITIILIIIT